MRHLATNQYMHFKIVLADQNRPLKPPKARLLVFRIDNWNAVEKRASLHLGQWYQLELVVSGQQFIGFIDGKKIIEAKDDHYDRGMVGLAINGAEVHFDDFWVKGDQVADENPPSTNTCRIVRYDNFASRMAKSNTGGKFALY